MFGSGKCVPTGKNTLQMLYAMDGAVTAIGFILIEDYACGLMGYT